MQVHYACIAFFCACIALVPLPPYSQNHIEYGYKKEPLFRQHQSK